MVVILATGQESSAQQSIIVIFKSLALSLTCYQKQQHQFLKNYDPYDFLKDCQIRPQPLLSSDWQFKRQKLTLRYPDELQQYDYRIDEAKQKNKLGYPQKSKNYQAQYIIFFLLNKAIFDSSIIFRYFHNTKSDNILKMFLSRLKTSYPFSKIFTDPLKAIEGIKDGSHLLVGGFGFCGVPMNLVNAIRLSQAKNLTITSNSCGVDGKDLKSDWGLSMLLRTKQISRMCFSHLGENVESQRQYFNGEIALDVCPQGTLAQKIRAGGAGIPAFYTPTGVGTVVQTGGYVIKYKKTQKGIQPQQVSKAKPVKQFKGKKFIQEDAIYGDFALVKAKRADTLGNLQFHKTARNFNADMATAAKIVVAQVEQIVQPGVIPPDAIHVPSVYVHRLYQMDRRSQYSGDLIQRLTLVDHLEVKRKVKYRSVYLNRLTYKENSDMPESATVRYRIARRAAQEVEDGMTVNLGIGIPTCLPEVLPHNKNIFIQSQNGVLGVGHHPTTDEVDPDDINAGKQTITLNPGGSYFSSSLSFGMIRGGHLDVTMLGSFQVSQTCDIANWMIPGKVMKGMGGAMDLVSSGSRVIVLMQHSALTKTGARQIKLVPECTLPLTGRGVASMVITELAVFQNRGGKLVLTQISEDTTFEEVQNQTGFKITCAEPLKRFT